MAKRTPEEDDVLQVENRVNGSHDDEEIMDDDGNEDYDEQRKKDKKKKKKKRKVRNLMSTSNQTDADRRVLRKRQRELHNDISFDAPTAASGAGTNNNNDSSEEEEGDDTTTKKSSGLLRWREKNNELWDDVRYTREAVLDSENMDLISSKAAREVEKIIQVSRLILFVV